MKCSVVSLIFSTYLLLALTACGESGNKKDLTPKEIDIQCDVNGDNLENFFEIEVSSDLSCLGSKLKLFTKIVEPDGAPYEGHLSRIALERYIRLDPELGGLVENLKFIELFFDITNLIFGDVDRPGYLKLERIDDITHFLIVANQNLVAMNKLLKDPVKRYEEIYSSAEKFDLFQKHLRNRETFLKHGNIIKDEMLKLFNKGKLRYLFYFPLDRMLEILHDEEESADEGLLKYKHLLFIKRVVLGGDSNSITQPQLQNLITRSENIMSAVFDLVQSPGIIFPNGQAQLKYLLDLLNRVEQIFYFRDDASVALFETEELSEALKVLKTKDGIQFSDYLDLIPEVKDVFMASRDSTFKMGDFLKLFDHARNVLQTGIDFTDYYRPNEKILSGKKRVLPGQLKLPNDLEKMGTIQRFEKVVNNYRYFKGKRKMPSFGNDYLRTSDGVAEIGMLEVVYEIVAEHYERVLPCTDKRLKEMPREGSDPVNMSCNKEDYAKTLTQGQLEYIVYKLKKPLLELDLVTKDREFSTAENGMLMTDLFQFQSDSDVTVDTAEGVEFALQLAAAVGMRDEIMLAIDSVCQQDSLFNTNTKQMAYKVECIRQNFFDVLGFNYTKYYDPVKNKIYIKPNYTLQPGEKLIETFTFYDFMPRFDEYRKRISAEEKKLFIYKMELFTRTCAVFDETMPYERADLVTIFGAIFNIEAALARFDVNSDNILLEKEVDAAYMHYKAGLKAIKDIPDLLLRPAFYTLIKDMKSPSALKVIWNKIHGRYARGAFIDQTVVAAVLAEIRVSSPSALTAAEKDKFCINSLHPAP
jgi:hypothetical protein